LLEYTREAAWFADQERIDYSNGTARAWITLVYATPSNGVKYVVALSELDCRQRRERSVAGNFYSVDGRVVESVVEDSFDYVVPNTVMDGILNAICADFSRWGSAEIPVVRVPVGIGVIEAADNLFASRRNSP